MVKLFFVFLLWAFSFASMSGVVYPATMTLSLPIKEAHDTRIVHVSVATAHRSCETWCGEWGLHVGKAYKLDEPKTDYAFGGADAFARITGARLWHRWGLGLTVFDNQDEYLDTPWTFHLSSQSGFWITESFAVALELHHWSNGRSGAEVLGIDDYWPTGKDGKSTNGGGDVLALGIIFSW